MRDYWGLFWETGIPSVWTMSRRAGADPMSDRAAQAWPVATLDTGTPLDPINMVPGDNAGRPVPTPDDGKTEQKR